MIKDITSTQNKKYKHIRSLKNKKFRMKYRQYTVEGIKSVKDALFANAPIDCIVTAESMRESFDFDEVYRVRDDIFPQLCDTENPQGVLAVINMKDNTDSLPEEKLYLYCDRISDPGNVGTIIRICDAVDCCLLLSEETADIYNPKTVRASMGSFFHTRICERVSQKTLEELQNKGYKIIAGALGDNTTDYSAADYGRKTVIVIGNEANGVCDDIINMADSCVKIPIWGRAESLNAAVAAALILYEAKKNQIS